MGLIEVITAGTTGAVLVKALDIIWLQKSLRHTEKIKWLREKRLEAYSELSAEILSLGTNLKTREDAFKGYSLAAKSMILTNDEQLASEIENFFTMISNIYKQGIMEADDPNKKNEEELEEAFVIVAHKSRDIVTALRKSLLKG